MNNTESLYNYNFYTLSLILIVFGTFLIVSDILVDLCKTVPLDICTPSC